MLPIALILGQRTMRFDWTYRTLKLAEMRGSVLQILIGARGLEGFSGMLRRFMCERRPYSIEDHFAAQ